MNHLFIFLVLFCQSSWRFCKVVGEDSEISASSDVYNENVTPVIEADTLLHRRYRRQTDNRVKINFINKSGREVRVYQVGLFGFFGFLRPQFDLRPNEPRALEVSPGTVWEVRDLDTGIYMLTNGKVRFRIRDVRKMEFTELRIRRPSYLPRKLKSFDPVPEKYLRIMIIADQTVTNYYGKATAKRYLHAVMSAVSKVFKDKSLGIKINIILTKLILMKSDPASYRLVENDPDASITNACHFAASLAAANRLNNHNFVAVLTRKSIGPSGYAAMYTMCTKKSCALVKESGFNTAYVIAHEAGHALGIDHDGEEKECEEDKLRGSIMAPKVFSKHVKYHWSKCSKISLYENIRYFPCLNYKPQEFEANEVDNFYDLPGELYPKADQCIAKFGQQARSCYVYYGACSFLWCKRDPWSRCAALALVPPLEGTGCGRDKWCIKGNCVRKKKVQAPIHGKWSSWSNFGLCKGLCGAGIKERTRKCDSPAPKHGGRKCTGKAIDIQPCGLKKCLSVLQKRTARDNKCVAKFGSDWKEYTTEMIRENLEQAKISCDFQDGPCGWNNDKSNKQKWLLISGPTKSGRTGPQSDHTYSTSSGQYLYYEASWINPFYQPRRGDSAKFTSKKILAPVVCLSFHYHMDGEHMGSLSVHKISDGVADKQIWSKEGSQGPEWYSAEVTISDAKAYQIVFESNRGGGFRSDIAIDDIGIKIGSCTYEEREKSSPCSLSCISKSDKTIKSTTLADGAPCHLDESLDVCHQGQCLAIGCDYKIDSGKEFDQCGVCEGAEKSCKVVQAKKTVTASTSLKEVFVIPEGSEKIKITTKRHPRLFTGIYIDDSNATNIFNTDGNKWPTGNYTFEGTILFYEQNKFHETITIPKLQGQGCRVMIYNPFARVLKHSPPEIEVSLEVRLPLTEDYDQFEYGVQSWTACTKSCDGGIQHPVLSCFEKNSERHLTDLYCNDIVSSDTVLSRACNIERCSERYIWQAGSWSTCSSSCGISVQSRTAKCFDRLTKNIVDFSLCVQQMPIVSRTCFAGPCSDYVFRTGEWSECSTSCGPGIQQRQISCTRKEPATGNRPLASCPGEYPVTAMPCNNKPCQIYNWVSYDFGDCSASCGGGVRIKIHTCKHAGSGNNVFESLCPQPRPSSIVYCNRFDC